MSGPQDLAMPNAPCWKKLLEYIADRIISLQKPIPKVSIYNTPVGANTNFIAPPQAQITPLIATNAPCIFRIYVALSVSGVFSVIRQSSSASTTENMNQGVALTANAGYMFDILVDQSERIDFQTTVAATILKFSVVEKDDAK